MPNTTRRAFLRRQRLARRLLALIDTLGAHDRRAPLPGAIAGPARRTLSDSARLLGTNPPAPTRRPADIFTATLQQLGALSARARPDDPAVSEAAKKIYPRPKPQP